MILLVICFTLLGLNVPKGVQYETIPMPGGSTIADCEGVAQFILTDIAKTGKVSLAGHSCASVPMLEQRAQ